MDTGNHSPDRAIPGIEAATTQTLRTIRTNLLHGLDQISKTIDNGTFSKVGAKGAAPPSQSGQLTLVLLQMVEAELKERGDL